MFPVHTVNICDSYFDPQIKMNVSPPVPTSETSITDGVYATLLSSVLGVSVLILCLSRFSSGVPIFGKDVAKLRRFWRHNSDVLDSDIFREIKYARPGFSIRRFLDPFAFLDRSFSIPNDPDPLPVGRSLSYN